jgi:hypothetical protein
MDSMSEGDFLCERCQENLQRAAKIDASLLNSHKYGAVIADLGSTDNWSSSSGCKLCQLLYSARVVVYDHLTEKSLTNYRRRVITWTSN